MKNNIAYADSPPDDSLIGTLVWNNRMNDPTGDIAHHFALRGTVKTIYVNPRQHRGLIAGALGVVILGNRHHLVPVSVAMQIRSVDSRIPVIIAEQAAVNDGVPDDLIW